MDSFARPKVVVSRCLGFDACRWNGVTVPDDFIESLKPYVNYVTVCPEVEIGLGVPREPIRVVLGGKEKKLLQPATGLDHTEKMVSFTDKFLSGLSLVDGFILKFRSPSCGIKKVKLYAGIDSKGAIGETTGFFGGEVMKRFPDKAIEDEGRLLNQRIREHFLIRLFTYASFREMKKKNSIKSLQEFHARNKLLYMAHNQKEMRELGRIVADSNGKDPKDVIDQYGSGLIKVFSRSATPKSNINVLMHAAGYFKGELNKKEKQVFLETLERYRAGKVCLSTASGIVSAWVARFDVGYLEKQTFFMPYPETLIQTGIPQDRGNLKTSI